jgi:glycosyltransferase involved in cell wall biosynthesis
MRDARVGGVVPCRNSAATLRGTLEALNAQTCRARLHVIVVDNGSTDDSATVAASLADAVLREATPGSYAARNTGMAALNTEIVLMVDADCRPANRHWATQHIDAWRDAPAEVFAIAGRLLPELDSDRWSQRADVTPHPVFTADGEPLYAVGGNCSLRRVVALQLGGFPPAAADDAALARVAQNAGLRTQWRPDALVYHRNPRGAVGYFRQMRKVGRYGAELGRPVASPRRRLAVEFARAAWVGGKNGAGGNPHEGAAAALRITAMAVGAYRVHRTNRSIALQLRDA